MPANPYTSATLSGFNSSPPPNDGSKVAGNLLDWDGQHIAKIGTPLKNYGDDINSNVNSAFGALIVTTDPGQETVVIMSRMFS